MLSANSDCLWKVNAPTNWPDPPSEMSVSTLINIEECPHRWGLATAKYPEIWTGYGYPQKVQLNSLSGLVVHSALELLTRELVHEGCLSARDSSTTEVLRRLGGFTKVIQDTIERIVARLKENPRAIPMIESANRALMSQVPELRTRVQTLLGRVRLPTVTNISPFSDQRMSRVPLSNGAYPEIEFRAKLIGWKGKIDLFLLSPDSCEIVDFKTGAQSEEHRFQVQVYALLWSRDQELNPTRRLVEKLTLIYRDQNIQVDAPSIEQLDALERDLINRRDQAQHAVATRPPKAQPSCENCRYCFVRQLCNSYWLPETQKNLSLARAGEESFFGDIEVTITGRHGPSSWDAVLNVSPNRAVGKQAVIRKAINDSSFRTGQVVRILDAHIAWTPEDETQPFVITMGSLSEAYVVS